MIRLSAVTAGANPDDGGGRFVPGRFRYRKVFLRGTDGRITGIAERREAWDIVWRRVL